MTSFRLSELPIPYRSAGASPLGAHEGTVTPPEPPTPPTPTGKTYFSGTSANVQQQGGLYIYMFDPSSGEYAHDFYEKQEGDELSVTVNGTTQTLSITGKEPGEEGGEVFADFDIGQLEEDIPLVMANVVAHVGEDDWTFGSLSYISTAEIPGGVTMTIADPA